MADNVSVYPGDTGSAFTVATDDVAGVHYQIVKAAFGVADSVTLVSSGDPLPVTLITGFATAAKQPALGTAGTASADVITVQGIASMTPFLVTVNSALPAGTNAIGKLAANDGVDIGDVDVTSVVPGTGASNLGKAEDAAHSSGDVGVMGLTVRQDTAAALSGTDGDYQPLVTDANGRLHVIAAVAASQTLGTVTTVSAVTTVSTLTGGGVAHDGVDSGNPVKVGAKAVATPSTSTLVSAADRTDLMADLDGALLVRQVALGDVISERVTDTGGSSTALTNFGATASTKNCISCVTVYNSSATAGYIDFRDGTGGAVLFTVPVPAGGGAVVGNGGAALFRSSANTAIAYDVSGALSTVYISVTGFKSKV
jgi:hypothetical protein